MFRLAFRTLRKRSGSFIATFIAVFVGAMIVMACGGLMETGVRANVPAQRLAGAPIVVAGDQSYKLTSGEDKTTLVERVPVRSDLVRTIAALPGVARAVPDISFPATTLRGDQPVAPDAQGHSWTSAGLAPYRLDAGTAPRQPDQVVLDAGIASRTGASVGQQVRLLVRGEPRQFTVSGVASATGVKQSALFFAPAEATALAGRADQLDAIGVQLLPGANVATIKKAIDRPGVVALTGPDRGVAEYPDVRRGASDLIVLAAVFGGMAAAVTLFVIASTLSLAARHRQRELALLRTIGMTPRQLRWMVRCEALAVAVLAAALAIVPAGAFGHWLFERMASHGVLPSVVTYYHGWIPLLAGLGVALLASFGAAVVAGHRAAKTRPIEALVEAGVQRRWVSPLRVLLAIIFLGGALALAIVTMTVLSGPISASTAGPSVICWAIGLALIGPGLTKVATAVLQWPLRFLSGQGGRLAALNVRARAIPMAAAVMPLMLATGVATANIYMQTTTVHELDRAYTHSVRADAVLTGANGLSPQLLAQVRRTPGVTAAGAYVASTGVIDYPHASQDSDGWHLQGVSGSAAAATMSLPVTAGRLGDLHGNTVALPVSEAHKLHRGIGEEITMRLGDRAAVRLRVVALFTARSGYETILLPVDLLAAHTTDGMPTQILVRASPQAISALSLKAWPGVHVGDRAALLADYDTGQQTGAWVNYLLVGMIVAYTVIAVANTLIAATTRRRREFGLQRLTGATRALVLRMMGLESLLVTIVGLALGTVVAMATLGPFCWSLRGSLLPSGPLWIYLVVIGSAVVLTFSATLVPGWVALRARPVEAAAAD